LVAARPLPNPLFALHKTVDQAVAVVVIRERKEQELQVLRDKVMTVALLHNLVMVVVVVLVHRVEMERLRMGEPLRVRVE
jgi:hypothetical protein